MFFLIFSLLGFHSHSQALPTKTNLYEKIINKTELPFKGRFWVRASENSNFFISPNGFQIEFGTNYKEFSFDMRATKSKMNYKKFSAVTDSKQSSQSIALSDTETGTERIRPRSDDDTWKSLEFEIGFSIKTQFFTQFLPLLQERIRIGMSIGTFQDEINSLQFQSTLFAIDTGLIYHLGNYSPWAIEGTLYWKTGNLVTKETAEQIAISDRELFATWVGSTIGIRYSF